jgi:hypothetical protein
VGVADGGGVGDGDGGAVSVGRSVALGVRVGGAPMVKVSLGTVAVVTMTFDVAVAVGVLGRRPSSSLEQAKRPAAASAATSTRTELGTVGTP